MVEICQSHLPIRPWEDDRLSRLPGLQPVAPGEWLVQDDAYTDQMAHRIALIQDKPDIVHKLRDTARPAADELLVTVLEELATTQGFEVSERSVIARTGEWCRSTLMRHF